jgi:hypothetical protein
LTTDPLYAQDIFYSLRAVTARHCINDFVRVVSLCDMGALEIARLRDEVTRLRQELSEVAA